MIYSDLTEAQLDDEIAALTKRVRDLAALGTRARIETLVDLKSQLTDISNEIGRRIALRTEAVAKAAHALADAATALLRTR